jgi:hypothetical protein
MAIRKPALRATAWRRDTLRGQVRPVPSGRKSNLTEGKQLATKYAHVVVDAGGRDW